MGAFRLVKAVRGTVSFRILLELFEDAIQFCIRLDKLARVEHKGVSS